VISPQLLISAYASGWFPMATDGEIRWYSPDPRAVFLRDDLRPIGIVPELAVGTIEIR